MRRTERFDLKLTLFVLFLCTKCFVSCDKIRALPSDVVSDLYLKYVEAVSDDKTNISSRRLFKNDKQYEIHVKKLKEVNGFKVHNLMVKENIRTGPYPLIYINNPVESKIPKAFLTMEEFKNVLTNRIIKQREELTNKPKTKLYKSNSNNKITNNPRKVSILNKLAPVNINKANNVNMTTIMYEIANSTDTMAYKHISNVSTREIIQTKIETNFINITKKEEPTTKSERPLEEHNTEANRTEKPLQEHNTETYRTEKLLEEHKTEINRPEKTLEEHNTETKRILHEIPETTANLYVTKKIFEKSENITVSSRPTTTIITTTFENFVEKDLEVTESDLSSLTDRNTKELDAIVDDNNDLITTDVKTSEDETAQTESTTKKEKPKRKSTTKLSVNSEFYRTDTKQKRSTLGRPLVFMGNR